MIYIYIIYIHTHTKEQNKGVKGSNYRKVKKALH